MRRTAPRLALLTAATFAFTAVSVGTALAQDTEVDEPASFTSMYTAMATPDTIINNDDQAVPGQPGATGTFNYRLNSDQEIICYDLTLNGIQGDYKSPAKTATHIHEAQPGQAGPPRIAFPNPTGDGDVRTSSGCLQGPFTTGVMADGQDTGTGFSLKEIEADPSAFFGDTHTAEYTAGAVRGQLTEVPMGGVETGAGATGGDTTAAVALGAAGLLAAAGVGAVAVRRNRAGS
ncbi:CHRD domain-containing protein [Pseudonocardia sediminis]|uniref:CHRD domain-containing protein n=1 Tax=Pseudonocardia sediminis TaxID=1397368 RepID=A0A4Q7UTD3_PSEST|nr:CHRD domain-containing protein [Pseudonocardia sediminis]RZT84995.1 CHRD domain-containing protein [Pseudonocardia sediminis]